MKEEIPKSNLIILGSQTAYKDVFTALWYGLTKQPLYLHLLLITYYFIYLHCSNNYIMSKEIRSTANITPSQKKMKKKENILNTCPSS